MVGSIPKTAMEKALIEQENTKFSKPIKKNLKQEVVTSTPHVVKHKGMHSEDLTSMNIDKVFDSKVYKLKSSLFWSVCV